jgi:hypothetical protein
MIKKVLLALLFICFSHPTFKLVEAEQKDKAIDTTFRKLQSDLNKEKYKKKVLSRFTEVEGQLGLTLEDIILSLLDYSYHILNDSGKPEPFITMRCDINSQFQDPNWPRILIGIIDNEKDELITFASVPKSIKPVVKFAELRRNKPEYMIVTLEPVDDYMTYNMQNSFNTAVVGFNEKNKTYEKVLNLTTYMRDTHRNFIERSTVSWSPWIKNKYRELIVITERRNMGEKSDIKPQFTKKEIYSWLNDMGMTLVERIIDGKRTMNRRDGGSLTLKDGELYKIRGQKIGNKITSTGGKIDSFLLSPDFRYVAYSIVVGYEEVVPLEGEGEKREVHHIEVLDLDYPEKAAVVIEPPDESEPFIDAERWISNERLLIMEADGFAVGLPHIYDAGNEELRVADLEEINFWNESRNMLQ